MFLLKQNQNKAVTKTKIFLSWPFARLSMLSLYQQSLKSKMKCTLIILFTFLALSTALKCQQCTGPGIFSLCNGINDNGIEVDCDGANDMACYYSTFPINGKSINWILKMKRSSIWFEKQEFYNTFVDAQKYQMELGVSTKMAK